MSHISRPRRITRASVPATDRTLDHGPTVLLNRGEIVREDRADIDSPNRTVAGARRKDGLRTMWLRGHVTEAQWAGAEAYRRDAAFASGARDRTPDHSGVRGTSRDYGPSALMLDAQQRVTGATQAVGIILNPVLCWVVIECGTVEEYAECRAMRASRAAEMVRDMLDRLADFYSR